MKIFITNLPSFYKVNLYNEIAKRKEIHVIFTGFSPEKRSKDFLNANTRFNYTTIQSGSKLLKLKQLRKILNMNYSELVVGSWNETISWFAIFMSSKSKNSLALESSYYESETNGFKGLLKKLFLSRIGKVYASGESQKKLAKDLGFKGSIVITKGVGVFNHTMQPSYVPREIVQNFLYVGRFSEEKNLRWLIEIFNGLDQLKLFMIGYGPLEKDLKNIAKSNITFLGEVKNIDLKQYYSKFDCFILPSLSETWGLVIEEALNNGMPVMVSDRVGCAEEIVKEENGLIFKVDDRKDFLLRLDQMTCLKYYNGLRQNISSYDFETIAQQQINKYVQ
jgi:glycosyltransferase involved in cell wall biosynthesis